MDIPLSGIVPNLPAAEYHAHPAISSTPLKKYRLPTAAHARHAIDNPKETSDALVCGQLLHTLLLEPEREDIDYVIEKERLGDKRGGSAKKAWDAMKKDAEDREIPIVPYDMYQRCIGMRDSIQAHELWQEIGGRGQKEISIFSHLFGQPVKARYDVMDGPLVLDLKTSRHHLTDKKIRSIIAELGYHISAAMYLEVGQNEKLPVTDFVWVFVESFAPYLCKFVAATPKMLEIGRQEFYSCLEKHVACSQNKAWPGYPTEILGVDLPDWYQMNDFEIPELEEITE